MQREARAHLFEAQRPRLLRLGYRMLGSLADAEDCVQEAWLRWSRAEIAAQEPAAYLTRILTNLCLDRLKSARARREHYVGAWLPEPLLQQPAEEPVLEEEIGFTLMLALERLSPLERAAFLLHDVFDLSYAEVAGALERDEPAVRQLASRARTHLRQDRPRFTVSAEQGQRLATAFFAAAQRGDLAALRDLLTEDATIVSDGGGKVIAFRNPIRGLARILRLYAGLTRKGITADARLLTPLTIDGLPGYASRERGDILQTVAFDIDGDRIRGIYIQRNPDKLGHVVRRLHDEGS